MAIVVNGITYVAVRNDFYIPEEIYGDLSLELEKRYNTQLPITLIFEDGTSAIGVLSHTIINNKDFHIPVYCLVHNQKAIEFDPTKIVKITNVPSEPKIFWSKSNNIKPDNHE